MVDLTRGVIMATQANVTEALEIGTEFAEAYAAGDYARVEALLDPEVHYREITPRRFVDTTGTAQILEEEREFLAGYDRHETLEVSASAVGSRVGARTRWRLHRGDETLVVEWCEYMTVEGGRIVALDAVCSGPMPE
jgi:ketosteroid isomerase-like protein